MSFYLPLGEDRFEPTKATESPWDPRRQRGGPPAALLGHQLRIDGLRLARISVDFLGPIPRRELRVEVSPLKPGRLSYLNEARMVVDGRPAVIARAGISHPARARRCRPRRESPTRCPNGRRTSSIPASATGATAGPASGGPAGATSTTSARRTSGAGSGCR